MGKRKEINYKDFNEFRQRERGEWLRKIFDLFKANFDIESKDFNSEQIDYMIRRFYYDGKICVLKDKVGNPLLCPFAPTSFNNNDYPVDITFINHRALPGLFPDSMQGKNMIDCVVGYIRPFKGNIIDIVEHHVNKIVDISVAMQINLFTQKLPYLLAVDSSDELNMKHIVDSLFNDEPIIFTKLNEPNKIQTLEGGLFNIDKLRQERVSEINELLTQLGIDNNNQEKKAQLLSDEVNSNNDEIRKSSQVYIKELEDFSKNIKDVLGFDITFKWNGVLDEPIEEENSNDREKDLQDKD